MGKSLFMTPFVEWCHEDYLFFLVDISDIHTVSNHSILKYEALPYHGRSLRAFKATIYYCIFQATKIKVCFR